MKNDFFNTEFDETIRASIKLADEPAPELNSQLKAALYQKEALMQKRPRTRSVSLWYLPMIFNFITFMMLAIAARMAISNPYLSYFAAGVCFYLGAAGILLTIIGIRRANIKEALTIRIEERSVLA